MNEQRTVRLLDAIQTRLEEDISYAAITETEDLFHEEEGRVVRAITFSRGTRETTVVIGEDGYLYHHHHVGERVGKELIPDICSSLFSFLAERDL